MLEELDIFLEEVLPELDAASFDERVPAADFI